MLATFALSSPRAGDWLLPWWVPAALPLLGAFWAAALRGGVLFSITGLALIRSDGRPAERWRCALRALPVWLPLALPLAASAWLSAQAPPRETFAWICWGVAGAAAAAATLLVLLRPARSLHDRIAGTWVVPK
jgi:hypothetical protein